MVAVVNILEAFNKEFVALNIMDHFLFTVSASVKFVIYYIFNDKFKKTIYKIFCCPAMAYKCCMYNAVDGGENIDVYGQPHNDNQANVTTSPMPGILLHNIESA